MPQWSKSVSIIHMLHSEMVSEMFNVYSWCCRMFMKIETKKLNHNQQQQQQPRIKRINRRTVANAIPKPITTYTRRKRLFLLPPNVTCIWWSIRISETSDIQIKKCLYPKTRVGRPKTKRNETMQSSNNNHNWQQKKTKINGYYYTSFMDVCGNHICLIF